MCRASRFNYDDHSGFANSFYCEDEDKKRLRPIDDDDVGQVNRQNGTRSSDPSRPGAGIIP